MGLNVVSKLETTGKGGRPKGTPKTGGRAKGVPNKTTALLKDAILQAAENAGGKDGLVGYLEAQATANSGPFMALLGKVLPMQLSGPDGTPLTVEVLRLASDASHSGS